MDGATPSTATPGMLALEISPMHLLWPLSCWMCLVFNGVAFGPLDDSADPLQVFGLSQLITWHKLAETGSLASLGQQHFVPIHKILHWYGSPAWEVELELPSLRDFQAALQI